MIKELIETLTEQEKATLHERIQTNNNQLYKFIGALVQYPGWTQKQLQQHFAINSNTYFKNVTLAKDEIYAIIKLHMRNAYDDLILSNILYRRGLEVHCSKLRARMEDEYIRMGWWNVLQELYNMQMMVAYTKCDVKWLQELKVKCFNNMDRLHRFTLVDREVIVQMAIIEKGDLKEKEYGAYAKNLTRILKEAEAVNHPTPIFNALHCFFVLYTQYEIDIDKAKAVVQKINAFIEKKETKGILAYVHNVALLNAVGFHIDFATGQSPDNDTGFKKVKAALGQHGILFDTQVWLDFCVYYFFENNIKEFDSSLARFSVLPLDPGLQYQADYLACLSAYLHRNRDNFYKHLHSFYAVERTRAHLNYDLYLRYLEMLVLIKDNDLALATDKLEAAIKFIRRNFTRQRIEIEKQHWDMLKTIMKGRKIKAPAKVVYRLTDFIYTELNALKR